MKEKKYCTLQTCVRAVSTVELPSSEAQGLSSSNDVTSFSRELLHQQGQEDLSVGLHCASANAVSWR